MSFSVNRFARQGHALVTGKIPVENGRPSSANLDAADWLQQTFVNGVPITDFKFDGMPDAGHIGLQVHGVKREDQVGLRVRWKNIQLKQLKSAAVTKPGKQEEPLAFPYLSTSERREGYALADEETNTYRVYDFYKRQAKHHLKQDRELALLPAYPDLDGGTFGHWGNYSKNGHQDLRWNKMDYGPAMAATYSIDKKKKIGGMLSLLIEGGHTVTFNKETGQLLQCLERTPVFPSAPLGCHSRSGRAQRRHRRGLETVVPRDHPGRQSHDPLLGPLSPRQAGGDPLRDWNITFPRQRDRGQAWRVRADPRCHRWWRHDPAS